MKIQRNSGRKKNKTDSYENSVFVDGIGSWRRFRFDYFIWENEFTS